MATSLTISGNNHESKKTKKTRKKTSDRIVGSNWCAMFLYNIPRGSLMVTFPGLVILITGAAMTGYIGSSPTWTDGLALIALVCLCVGGFWTLGGIAFWVGAWCRYKPPMQNKAKHDATLPSIVVVDGIGNVNMDAVIPYPAFDDDDDDVPTSSRKYTMSQSKTPMTPESSTEDIAMDSIGFNGKAETSYQAEAYPYETVFTVP